MFVDPLSHRGYVVTKSLFGQSEVFELPASPNATSVQLLSRVGAIDFDFTGTPGGPNLIGQLTATGASMSADGRRLVVRTYTDAYLWTVSGSDVPGALRAEPIRTALPAQPLGEGIAFGGRGLLIDTEGTGTAVQTLGLLALPRPTARPNSASPPRPTGTHHQKTSPTTANAAHEHGHSSVRWTAGACGIGIAAAVITAWVLRRRRRD